MDFFSDVSEYVKTRLTNPFLGTLLFVVIFHNFEFLFVLFNFEDGVTLTQKVEYIRKYASLNFNVEHWFWYVLSATFILMMVFILLLFTRWLTNIYTFFQNFINEKSAKASMAPIEEISKRDVKIKSLKAEKEELQKDYDGLEVFSKELQKTLGEKQVELNNILKENKGLKDELDNSDRNLKNEIYDIPPTEVLTLNSSTIHHIVEDIMVEKNFTDDLIDTIQIRLKDRNINSVLEKMANKTVTTIEKIFERGQAAEFFSILLDLNNYKLGNKYYTKEDVKILLDYDLAKIAINTPEFTSGFIDMNESMRIFINYLFKGVTPN